MQSRSGTRAGFVPTCCTVRSILRAKIEVKSVVVRKSVLLFFTLVGLGVAAYFVLPLTPVPDYIDAVLNRASLLFGSEIEG